LLCPLGIKTEVFFNLFITGGGAEVVYVSNPATDDIAPSDTGNALGSAKVQPGGDMNGPVQVTSNTSSQVRARSTALNTTFRVATLGWNDINL
jgi:hypothetical protein